MCVTRPKKGFLYLPHPCGFLAEPPTLYMYVYKVQKKKFVLPSTKKNLWKPRKFRFLEPFDGWPIIVIDRRNYLIWERPLDLTQVRFPTMAQLRSKKFIWAGCAENALSRKKNSGAHLDTCHTSLAQPRWQSYKNMGGECVQIDGVGGLKKSCGENCFLKPWAGGTVYTVLYWIYCNVKRICLTFLVKKYKLKKSLWLSILSNFPPRVSWILIRKSPWFILLPLRCVQQTSVSCAPKGFFYSYDRAVKLQKRS